MFMCPVHTAPLATPQGKATRSRQERMMSALQAIVFLNTTRVNSSPPCPVQEKPHYCGIYQKSKFIKNYILRTNNTGTTQDQREKNRNLKSMLS